LQVWKGTEMLGLEEAGSWVKIAEACGKKEKRY
jgi:hypothetical protein